MPNGEETQQLSLVIPVFNEREAVPQLLERVAAATQGLSLDIQYIFVNNASTDGTTEIVDELCDGEQCVTHILMSRNFGPTVEASIVAGLAHATGDAVVILYGDLQDPPEVIPRMVTAWRNGADVVHGIQASRAGDTRARRLWGKMFYRLMRQVSEFDIPVDAGDFKLVTRRVYEIMLALPERERYFRGLASWIGFSHAYVDYARDARTSGVSKSNYGAIVQTAWRAITASTTAPLRLLTWGGAFALISAGAYTVVLVLLSIFGAPQPGFSTIYVLVAFSTGLNLFAVGILGEYVGRVLTEVKLRPHYVVERIHESHSSRGRAANI